MTGQPLDSRTEAPVPDSLIDVEEQAPGLLDAVRFLYRWRIRLAFHALAIFTLGALVFLYFFFASPKTVEGTVGLAFHGIEKSEYPSGRQFSVEDFRSPRVLAKALADAAIPPQRISSWDLAGHVTITPLIPADVENRWKKQEQAGQKKEGYSPTEFDIAIDVQGLSNPEYLRLFDGLVNRYQESTKYDQKPAQWFMASWDSSYEMLANTYDAWEIPGFFRDTYGSLNRHLQTLVEESAKYQDADFQLSFLKIAKDLDSWERTRLEAVEALTYQARLVKGKGIITQRIQYRIQDLAIQIRQKSQEAADATRLLETIQGPKALAANQVSSREVVPVIDAGVLDKLIRGDYVGPVVERISDLHEAVQALGIEKARLDRQLSLLLKSPTSDLRRLPPGYNDLITALSGELSEIIQRYNRVLDNYLAAMITSSVVVKQAPLVSREAYSPILAFPGIAFLSIFLGIVLLAIERLLARAREQAYK